MGELPSQCSQAMACLMSKDEPRLKECLAIVLALLQRLDTNSPELLSMPYLMLPLKAALGNGLATEEAAKCIREVARVMQGDLVEVLTPAGVIELLSRVVMVLSESVEQMKKR
ncbi:unnamed protein product, partial [Chrysoparadoxa australica]